MWIVQVDKSVNQNEPASYSGRVQGKARRQKGAIRVNLYVDLHCDTITMMNDAKENMVSNSRMVSIPDMKKGGVLVQCFSAFVPTGYYPKPVKNTLAWHTFCKIADKKDRLLKRHTDALVPVLSVHDIVQCRDKEKVGAVFTIEDAGVVGRNGDRLTEAYERGVRIASLTWNHENTLGFPNSAKAKRMQKGLKTFGIESVERMNELGIIVDVSHLSDGGFWDVVRTSKKPFVATHSNSRAVTNHPRNMTDKMIRALAERGGVIGLNFAPLFLDEKGKQSRVQDMVRHVLHVKDVGGSEVLAIGSDFDGIHGKLEIDTPAKMPLLAETLQRAGLTGREVDAMWSSNALRVFEEAW